MARYRTTPRRRRIFVGTEGESERSFAAWLKQLCDEAAPSRVHLDVSLGHGGDGQRVVEDAVGEYRRRSTRHGKFSDALVLLDADRLEDDRRHGRDPADAVRGTDLRLVLLRPNLEGVLARLHRGYEARRFSARDAARILHAEWPEYRKPASAYELRRRFGLGDMRRASAFDAELREILEVLGLT